MTEDNGKVKSVARTEKSITTLATALGPEVLNLLVPGSGLAFKLLEILSKHGWQFHVDRGKLRLDQFHQALLTGMKTQEFESFINKPFSLEDYYTLVDSALRDQEDTKVPVYSKFFISLVEQSVPERYRIHLIKALRGLTCSDLDLLRRIYISSKHDFVGKGGKIDQLKKLLETTDPIRALSVQTLIALGFIRLPMQGEGASPTDLLKVFVNAAFDQSELTPASIEESAWLPIRPVFIIISDLQRYMEKYADVGTVLEETLTELNIRCAGVSTPPKGEPHINLVMSSGLIVLLDAEMDQKDSVMAIFLNNPKIKIKNIIKILLSTSSDGTGLDPLPDIQALASFNFIAPRGSYETKEFKEFINTLSNSNVSKITE